MFVFCSFAFPVFRMVIVGLAGSPTETRQRQAEIAGYVTWYIYTGMDKTSLDTALGVYL